MFVDIMEIKNIFIIIYVYNYILTMIIFFKITCCTMQYLKTCRLFYYFICYCYYLSVFAMIILKYLETKNVTFVLY